MSDLRHAASALAVTLFVASSAGAQPGAREVVAELRVHGNHSVPDAHVIRLAGIEPGDEIEAHTLEAIAVRLRESELFDHVEVRKRHTSLRRSHNVALIIVVRERPASARRVLFMPTLEHAEGHGWTYGARFTSVDVLGEGSRLSAPLTAGGTRAAGLELEKHLDAGPVHTIRGAVTASRLENQHYLVEDRRVSTRFRADRRIADDLTVSVAAGWNDVRFGRVNERFATYRIGVVMDTRNSAYPRDALFVRAGWQLLVPGMSGSAISTWELDARGYFGLSGRTVFAVRALFHGASAALPRYAQPLLGGAASVRGHRAGARAGDQLLAMSTELRMPISSPRRLGRVGVRLFYDTGATYNVHERLGYARFSQGAGGGLFWSLSFLALQLDAAHDLRGHGRLHFTTTAMF